MEAYSIERARYDLALTKLLTHWPVLAISQVECAPTSKVTPSGRPHTGGIVNVPLIGWRSLLRFPSEFGLVSYHRLPAAGSGGEDVHDPGRFANSA